jgi:predicted outer membrane repeat protein
MSAWADVRYVNVQSSCGGACGTCGATWLTAFTSLQAAADCAPTTGDVEFWVAEGTYGPVSLGASHNPSLKFYGGFTGSETSLSQADPVRNRAYISGGGTAVALSLLGNHARFRGFHIVRGYQGTIQFYDHGAGAYLTNSNAVFVECVFTANKAVYVGGALSIMYDSNPTFVNCRFYGNDGGWAGGAMWADYFCDGTFVNCVFHDNFAWEGGAVFSAASSLNFINCTFSQNQAFYGGGGAIFDDQGTIVLRNCIFRDNRGFHPGSNELWARRVNTVTHTNIKGGWPGIGNIDVDAQFAYSSGNNFSLRSASPCRNTGDASWLPPDTYDLDWDGNITEPIPLDLTRGPRVLDGTIDMGALESDGRRYFADVIPKNRYLSVAMDQPSGLTALRVTLVRSELFPAANGRQWWVSTPFTANDGGQTIQVARVGCNPIFRDWSTTPVVHLGDTEIVPRSLYRVEAVALGAPLCDPASYQSSMFIRTADVWGDIASPPPVVDPPYSPLPPWNEPDGLVTQDDLDAEGDKFANHPGAPPLPSCDLDPAVPNTTADTSDQIRVQDSINDPLHTYPFSAPAACSCGATCCNFGKCCGNNGSCSNTVQSGCSGTWTAGVMCESATPACSGGGPPD